MLEDEKRYTALQTGYREALLVQLDLVITEMLDEGDFAPEQVTDAVETRLRRGPGSLRGSKVSEDWDAPPGED